MNSPMVLIAVMALMTMALRFAPFLIFRKGNVPEFVLYLGQVLPYSVMGMLVIYCLKGVNFLAGSRGIPELLAVCAVVFLHKWKRNTLLSILGGTLLYMLLVQMVF